MNINDYDIWHMMEFYGAEVIDTHHNHEKIKLNGQEYTFMKAHGGHKLHSKDEIVSLRHFLFKCGLAPPDYVHHEPEVIDEIPDVGRGEEDNTHHAHKKE